VSIRLENTLARLEQIIGRLDTRIQIMKESGTDTSLALIELDKARLAVTAARTTLATIDRDVAVATQGTDVQSKWPTVRATYKNAQADILSAHAALIASVAALRNSSATKPASTTPITTGN
jgi:hypothetical protein